MNLLARKREGGLSPAAAFVLFFALLLLANAAHLGGILPGFFYARQITRGGWPNWSFLARRQPPREIAGRIQEKKFWRANATPPPEELSAEEYLQKEVDPILDKISEHGIQSLTAREKQILEKARAKMARR